MDPWSKGRAIAVVGHTSTVVIESSWAIGLGELGLGEEPTDHT